MPARVEAGAAGTSAPRPLSAAKAKEALLLRATSGLPASPAIPAWSDRAGAAFHATPTGARVTPPPPHSVARALRAALHAPGALLLCRSRSPAAMQATALAHSAPCSARAAPAAGPARQAAAACPLRPSIHGVSLAAPGARQQLAAARSRPGRPAAAGSALRVYAAAKAPWEGKPTARCDGGAV